MEEILDERARAGGKEYLVRWRGYGEEEDTWEPEENIHHSLVKEFLACRQEHKQAKRTGQTRRVAAAGAWPADHFTTDHFGLA